MDDLSSSILVDMMGVFGLSRHVFDIIFFRLSLAVCSLCSAFYWMALPIFREVFIFVPMLLFMIIILYNILNSLFL